MKKIRKWILILMIPFLIVALTDMSEVATIHVGIFTGSFLLLAGLLVLVQYRIGEWENSNRR